MSYQLPLLSDDEQFERLVRDIVRRVYNDPGAERFGVKGQRQDGIDGLSPQNPGITFQCKLKDTRYKTDEALRRKLLEEMEQEFAKTSGLAVAPRRFIFATTFKNDTQLQQKAASLSTDSTTVEYWGWDIITERVWEYAEALIPTYFPFCPIRTIVGFRQITPQTIAKARTTDAVELNKLAMEYYRINDRDEVVFRVVCNDIDVRNAKVMSEVFDRLQAIGPNGTTWILGSGGSGKTTILHRVAVELAERGQNVYMLDLEADLSKDEIKSVLSLLKYGATAEQTVLCIDNPAADEETLETLLQRLPDSCPQIHVLLAEREHRYKALRGTDTLTCLHGEEEREPITVRNTRQQRQRVYDKLFRLLEVEGEDRETLNQIVLNERLVYVNATYSILLELKKKRKINFDFDWDDYRKSCEPVPAFSGGYKYIALFYLFGVRMPFTALSRIVKASDEQQARFLERFRGLVNEPIIVDERRDESYRKHVHVRTKHEIISEIFFGEHGEFDETELLMECCEAIDFSDAVESQALVNIFGAKKNYTAENAHIKFQQLVTFLLDGYLRDKVALSRKLNATLHLGKFWLLSFEDRPAEAIAALEAFLAKNPEDLHSRTEVAKLYQRQGEFDKAESVLLEVLDRKPNDLNSRTELAKVYQRQSKQAQAEAVLLDLLQLDPNNLQARTELSKIYQRQGKLAEAEAVLLRVLEIRRNDLNSRTELAKIYQRQGKLAEAEAVLMELLKLEPNDLQARTELAKIYQRQGKLAEAEALLLRLLKLDTSNLQARTELAKIYQRQSRWAEAIKRLEEYIELEPNGLHPRTELAKIYQRQGKLAEAEAVLLRVLEIRWNDLNSRTELAKIYQRQGKLAEAEAVLMELLKLEPNDLQARTELAKIYQRQSRWAEAIKRLEEYIELDPNGLHPRIELARIYQRQGRLIEAEQRAEEALAIDSLNDHALSELLAIWRRQRKKDECRRRFEEFIAQPGFRFSRYFQAPVLRFFQCCKAFGMKEAARQVFERFGSQLDERNLQFYDDNFT
ncbi:MAG: tetratricopeptide repeat protein [Blastocatellia bacterium]